MIKSFRQFSQISLAGIFVLLAATLGQFSEQPRPEPTPLIQELATIEKQVRQDQVKASPPSPTRDLIEAAKDMSSINDFNKLTLNSVEKQLIERVQSDEFNQGNPFYSMNNVYPIALILQKGVKSFNRDAYRSPQFMGGMGYDVVKYEILHTDRSKSYILAYKEKTGPDQVAIGRRDSRPVFSLFLVPHDQDQVYMSLYENGQPVTNHVVATESALSQITARVDQSTPLLSSREPQSTPSK
ncbi:MAG: hypothetical protein AB7N80_10840 [Bdellovibrionales bacterium]